MLKPTVVWFTWFFVVVFFPVETYLTLAHAAADGGADANWNLLSEYSVNVSGVVIMFWGLISLHRGRPFARGVLASGWGWMTAVFWRGTNLRFRLAADGVPLTFGADRLELRLAPVATVLMAAGLAASLALLLKHSERQVSAELR